MRDPRRYGIEHDVEWLLQNLRSHRNGETHNHPFDKWDRIILGLVRGEGPHIDTLREMGIVSPNQPWTLLTSPQLDVNFYTELNSSYKQIPFHPFPAIEKLVRAHFDDTVQPFDIAFLRVSQQIEGQLGTLKAIQAGKSQNITTISPITIMW